MGSWLIPIVLQIFNAFIDGELCWMLENDEWLAAVGFETNQVGLAFGIRANKWILSAVNFTQ